jgi:hypothetical protein
LTYHNCRDGDPVEASSVQLERKQQTVDIRYLPNMRVIAPRYGRSQNPFQTRQSVIHVVTGDNQVIDRADIDCFSPLHIGNPAGHEQADFERDIMSHPAAYTCFFHPFALGGSALRFESATLSYEVFYRKGFGPAKLGRDLSG